MLQLDWNIIWTVVNLLVLYALLKKFLFGPVTAIMDRRKKLIEDQFGDAERKTAEADAKKQEYEALLADAYAQAAQIVRAAQHKAAQEYDQILLDAHSDAKRIIAEAQKTAALEREQALCDAQDSIAGIVLLATAKVTHQNMNSVENEAYVQSLLSGLEAS